MSALEELEEDVLRWLDETRSILVSIKRIVEYFGDEDEYESLLASLVLPEVFLEGVIPAFQNPLWRATTTGIRPSHFACQRTVAAMINPLLQIIVEPVPGFVPLARKELERSHFKALIRHVGGFTGSISVDICIPLWRAFPDLMPEGWEAVAQEGSTEPKSDQARGDDEK